jgi:hypothetical protein
MTTSAHICADNPQCCMCGQLDLSTDEDGGPECELHDGRWVCSHQCYDRAVEPAGPNVAGFWIVLALIANAIILIVGLTYLLIFQFAFIWFGVLP